MRQHPGGNRGRHHFPCHWRWMNIYWWTYRYVFIQLVDIIIMNANVKLFNGKMYQKNSHFSVSVDAPSGDRSTRYNLLSVKLGLEAEYIFQKRYLPLRMRANIYVCDWNIASIIVMLHGWNSWTAKLLHMSGWTWASDEREQWMADVTLLYRRQGIRSRKIAVKLSMWYAR